MTSDTPREHAPEQDQDLPAEADTTRTTVSTPETDGARVAEAGHGYTGRQMDDSLKSAPRERGDGEVDDTDA